MGRVGKAIHKISHKHENMFNFINDCFVKTVYFIAIYYQLLYCQQTVSKSQCCSHKGTLRFKEENQTI